MFLALADDAGVAQASCRIIVPGGRLKTLDDLPAPPWGVDGVRSARAAGIDPATTWDVGTLGVRAGIGSTAVMAAAALYHGLMTAVLVNGGRTVISIIDERVRTMLSAAGIQTHLLPGSTTSTYLGSPASSPLYAHMDVVLDHQRRVAPEAYRLITQGIGLDGIAVPPREAFRLAPARRQVIRLPASDPIVLPIETDVPADTPG